MLTERESPEACPPPLLWQDVRREYLAQSAVEQIDTPTGPVAARVLGNGPALYLLPGFSCPAELYCLLVWLLRDEFQCVTVEPSGEPPSGVRWSMNDLAESLELVADRWGHRSLSLFGTNFGAAWGLAAARQMPQRISRLILLQGFARRRLSFGERTLLQLCRLSSRTLNSFPGRVVFQTQNHARWFPPFDSTRWQYYLDATGAMPLRELSRRASAIQRFDMRDQFADVSVPVLLIRTEGEGRVAGDCQKDLEQRLTQVEVEWLHTTGQLPYLTHPHRLAKLIRTFCAERSAEAVHPAI